MLKRRITKLLFGVLALALTLSLLTVGCKKGGGKVASTSKDGEAAAIVNGEKILKSDLDAIVAMYSGSQGMGMHDADVAIDEESIAKLRESMLAQMIDGEILYQVSKQYPVEGLEEKAAAEYANIIKQYATEDEFKKEVEKNNLTIDKIKKNLKKNITIQNFINNEMMAKISITEEQMKEYYEANKSSYDTSEQLKASHILVKVDKDATEEQKKEAMSKITKAKERVAKGEDFAAVAKEVSEGPSGPKGGDLGFFGRNRMVKPFEEAAFATNVGEVSDVVTTQYGYHIIKINEKKDAEAKSYEDVKTSIEEALKKKEFQTSMTKLIDEKKAAAKIESFE